MMSEDKVNHPKHYTSNKSGVECIDVVEHMNFNLGNAVKYIWRADEKGNPIEDLEKAVWYLNREIERRTKDNDKHHIDPHFIQMSDVEAQRRWGEMGKQK